MKFEIVGDRLAIDGDEVVFVKATKIGGRILPELIVVHDTAGPSASSAINTFKSPSATTSAHVVVDLDGTITQMVPFDCKANHAGESSWKGRRYCNGFSIGIEIVNPGELTKDGRAWFHKKNAKGYDPVVARTTPAHGSGRYWYGYTQAQVSAVEQLCRALVKAYPTIKAVTTHWEISPGRKVDTNPLFPLERVRATAFGKTPAAVDPAPAPAVPEAPIEPLEIGAHGDEVSRAQELLKALGYPVGALDGRFGPQLRIAVLGFEAENKLPTDGMLSLSDMALLDSPDAKAMPRGAREEATAADVAATGSGIFAAGQSLARWGWGLIVTVLGWFGIEIGGGIDTAEKIIDSAERVQKIAKKVEPAIVTFPASKVVLFCALIAIGLLGYCLVRWGSGIKAKRVEDHRTGANTGR